jgi:hypothetical protein
VTSGWMARGHQTLRHRGEAGVRRVIRGAECA